MPRKTPAHPKNTRSYAVSGRPRRYGRRLARSTRPRHRLAAGSSQVARVYRKRRTGRVPRTLRPTWANPLSPTASFKFRYADSGFGLTTAAGGDVAVYQFRGNGPYDPDATGVGVQPYGWDFYASATQYQAYVVTGAKIIVKAALQDATTDFVITVVPHRNGFLSYTDLNDLRVLPHSRQKRVSYYDGALGTLTSYVTTKQMFPEFDMKDAGYRSAYNALPTYGWYFYVVGDTTSVGASKSLLFDVEIHYYVKLIKQDDNNES